MRNKLQNLWDNVQSSLWFIPTVLLGVAVLGSVLLIDADVLLQQQNSTLPEWLFSGTADAARTLLSVVAGSLITVISIAISLTIIALVQASAQFTPRVLRRFSASRTNQVVLGTYTATFVYALLVLRTVRSADEGTPFIPAISVTTAVILAVLCLGLLIFFIHHMAQSLQVAVIMDEVRQEIITQIDNQYPENIGTAILDPVSVSILKEQLPHREPSIVVRAESSGFVCRIDESSLLDAPLESTRWLWIRPQIGEYVAHGTIIAELSHTGDVPDDLVKHIRNSFVLGRERTIAQDMLFGIRQLVDIALKALSPGINDVTTAEYALYHLEDAVGRLGGRAFPSNIRTPDNGHTQILFAHPTWDEIVDTAFSQIQSTAASDFHFTKTLLQVLHGLALRLPPGSRAKALQPQIAEVRYEVAHSSFSPNAKALLNNMSDNIEDVLQMQLNS